jgi:serine protease AprX
VRRVAGALAVTLALVAALLVPGVGEAADLDTYLVTFDAPPTASQLETLTGVAAGVHGFRHLPVAAVVASPVDLPLLVNLPAVRRVVPNRSYEPLLQGSTSTMRADAAWDLGWTGEGVGIAVIDTGIDGTHPDLCAAQEFCPGEPVKTVQNVKILGRQSLAPEPVVVLEDQVNTDTSSGHGTHVAGIAAGTGIASVEPGRYRGVAPGASLIGLGTGEAIEAVNVLAAFDWVIEHADTYDIKVINNSWGPGRGEPYDPGYPVHLAIDAAHAAGLTVVFGAGNDGPATDSLNAFSANPKAISVAGGEKGGHLAFFSSRGVPGSELWRPTVTAPGYHVVAARAATGFLTHAADLAAPNPDPIDPEDLDRYASGSGTSMASPHVAGLVALLQQAARESRGVWLTPDEVRDILVATAVSEDPARGPGGLPTYQRYTMGAGYVDASAAVQAAASGSWAWRRRSGRSR